VDTALLSATEAASLSPAFTATITFFIAVFTWDLIILFLSVFLLITLILFFADLILANVFSS
jgi:hypothetical protein